MCRKGHQRCLRGVMLALAVDLWGVVFASGAAANDVYFAATSAYNRRDYDPFDQATATSFEASPSDSSEIRLASEFRLIDGEWFAQPPSETKAAVAPTALQVSPRSTPEPLPTPANAPAAAPDEPGADWTPKPLSDLTTNINLPGGDLPHDYWSQRPPQHVEFFDPCGATRGWPVTSYNWVASCFCSNPLYFEEINLERYGYGCGCCGPCCSTCVQSVASGAHFFANVVALPYYMGADCPCSCDYTLGHYRPGSCPPWRWTCCSTCSALGAVSAGGVATGLIFLIP
jgi:hypothetical protein